MQGGCKVVRQMRDYNSCWLIDNNSYLNWRWGGLQGLGAVSSTANWLVFIPY
jgi:hypothetical protein